MQIRPYENADQAAVLALWRDCGLVVPQNDPAKDIERKLRHQRELFLVGLTGAQIVATVMGGYDGHRGWINYLAVKPEQQGRGYGQKIMQAVEASISALGCPKINLQVRAGNAEVQAFYAAQGYGTDNVVGMGKRLLSDQ